MFTQISVYFNSFLIKAILRKVQINIRKSKLNESNVPHAPIMSCPPSLIMEDDSLGTLVKGGGFSTSTETGTPSLVDDNCCRIRLCCLDAGCLAWDCACQLLCLKCNIPKSLGLTFGVLHFSLLPYFLLIIIFIC